MAEASFKTLRDEFAIAAMHALLSVHPKDPEQIDKIPWLSYGIADAMMKARDAE